MLSFEQYSLSVKNTRSKLGNLGIITYIKRESKEDSIARRGAGVLTQWQVQQIYCSRALENVFI